MVASVLSGTSLPKLDSKVHGDIRVFKKVHCSSARHVHPILKSLAICRSRPKARGRNLVISEAREAVLFVHSLRIVLSKVENTIRVLRAMDLDEDEGELG